MTPQLISKQPQLGTNIFTVMSGLAAEVGAVNLGQGFPDFECDPKLIQAVTNSMQVGLNQYPPMPGVLPLREAVSQKLKSSITIATMYKPKSQSRQAQRKLYSPSCWRWCTQVMK